MLNILTDLNGSYTALHGGIDLKHPNGSSRIITEHHASNTLEIHKILTDLHGILTEFNGGTNPNGSSRNFNGS